jgi:predicted site-specific integrase-resolvase
MNLYTPEDIAQRFPLIKAGWLRRLAREGRIEHTRLERGRIAFTDQQVNEAIAKHASSTTKAPARSSLTTARARRRTA